MGDLFLSLSLSLSLSCFSELQEAKGGWRERGSEKGTEGEREMGERTRERKKNQQEQVRGSKRKDSNEKLTAPYRIIPKVRKAG